MPPTSIYKYKKYFNEQKCVFEHCRVVKTIDVHAARLVDMVELV
jgi:hypothetical protein